MFHSVGLEEHPWTWSYISESVDSFEAKISLLKRSGFNAIFWQELYDYMAGLRDLPENSILLTFDDGYLDNWAYVYPILKKYEMKGTIFVSADFVDPDPDVRPKMDDSADGRQKLIESCPAGFLNWAEMRVMEKSGLIDIQSHASTHTWYFSSPRIADVHRPHDVAPYPWLFWNERPDRKPYYLTEDQQGYLPWGYPILNHHKSLEVKRFFPDPVAMNSITNFVSDSGGRQFFENREWRAKLEKHVEKNFDNLEMPGHYESDQQKRDRISAELSNSKNQLEGNLEKEVNFICWPGGANDEEVQRLATDIGYKSWTLESSGEQGKRNIPGADPVSIKRIGTNNRINVRGRRCGLGGATFQLMRVREHQGSFLYSTLIKGYKLAALVKSKGGVR